MPGGDCRRIDDAIDTATKEADAAKLCGREALAASERNKIARPMCLVKAHRFALLFRDFLRADANACRQYHEFKMQAALAYPNDIDGYLALKAPVFNLLYNMAESWAKMNQWNESCHVTPVANKSSGRTR